MSWLWLDLLRLFLNWLLVCISVYWHIQVLCRWEILSCFSDVLLIILIIKLFRSKVIFLSNILLISSCFFKLSNFILIVPIRNVSLLDLVFCNIDSLVRSRVKFKIFSYSISQLNVLRYSRSLCFHFRCSNIFNTSNRILMSNLLLTKSLFNLTYSLTKRLLSVLFWWFVW